MFTVVVYRSCCPVAVNGTGFCSKMKNTHGGRRPNAGRKKRTGEPLVNTTVQVERSVILAARETHGSLAKALRASIKVKSDFNEMIQEGKTTLK